MITLHTELKAHIIYSVQYFYSSNTVNFFEYPVEQQDNPGILHCEVFKNSIAGGYTVMLMDRSITLNFSDKSGVNAEQAVILMSVVEGQRVAALEGGS